MDRLQDNKQIIKKLKDSINKDSKILFTGAGSGISAKFQEKGGSDGIIILSSGKFRMAGNPSLSAIMPYENSNRIVKNLCKEINNVVDKTPLFAGLCCTDPTINKELYLMPDNDSYKPIQITTDMNFQIWGIVTHTIHKTK